MALTPEQRQSYEALAGWSYDSLLAALNDVESAASTHLGHLEVLLPKHHNSKDVVNGLLCRVREAKVAFGAKYTGSEWE